MRLVILTVFAVFVLWAFNQASQTDSTRVRALEQVMADNRALRQEIAELRTRHAENTDYMESQAGLAQACDWLFPSCPEAAVQVGQQAIEQGYAGINSPSFWLVFLIKLAVLAAPVGAALGIARWIWVYRGRPTALATRQAKETLTQAQTMLQTVLARLDASAQIEKNLGVEIKTARGKLRTLRRQVERKTEEIERLSLREAELRKTMAALRGK